jgi:hypothetical protein
MTREEKIAFIMQKRQEFRDVWVRYHKPKADKLTQKIIDELKEKGISDEALLVCDDMLELLIEKGLIKI